MPVTTVTILFSAMHFGGLLEKLLAFGGVDLKVGGGDDEYD